MPPMSIFYRGKTLRNKAADDAYVAALFDRLDAARSHDGGREVVSAVCDALSSFMKVETAALSNAPQQAAEQKQSLPRMETDPAA
jgi:hypothetical protein